MQWSNVYIWCQSFAIFFSMWNLMLPAKYFLVTALHRFDGNKPIEICNAWRFIMQLKPICQRIPFSKFNSKFRFNFTRTWYLNDCSGCINVLWLLDCMICHAPSSLRSVVVVFVVVWAIISHPGDLIKWKVLLCLSFHSIGSFVETSLKSKQNAIVI